MKMLFLALTTLSALMTAQAAHGAQAQYEVMSCSFKSVKPGEKFDLKLVAKIQNRDKNQDFTDVGDGSVSIAFEATPTIIGGVKVKGSSLVSVKKTRSANGAVVSINSSSTTGAALAMRTVQGAWINQLFADQPQLGASFNDVANYVFKVQVDEDNSNNPWAGQLGRLKDITVTVTTLANQTGAQIAVDGTKTNGEPVPFIQSEGTCSSDFVNLPSAL